MDADLSSFISPFGGRESSEMAGQQVRSTNACDMVSEGHYIAIPWHIRSLPARAPVGRAARPNESSTTQGRSSRDGATKLSGR